MFEFIELTNSNNGKRISVRKDDIDILFEGVPVLIDGKPFPAATSITMRNGQSFVVREDYSKLLELLK